MNRLLLFPAAISALLWAAQPCLAQNALATRPQPWMARGSEKKIVSPEIMPDGRITFRINAPTANQVQLDIGTEYADEGKYTMAKGPDGTWSVTIGPVKPEVYPYNYLIGGAVVNADTVEMPSKTPLFYEHQNVPHGAVISHHYFSTVEKRERPLTVYVPPQYYAEPDHAFPVLYLWSQAVGQGSNWVPFDPGVPQWVRARRLDDILDNQIAAKRAVPMIVVMMDVRAAPGLERDSAAGRPQFSKAAAIDIIPFVEKHYRTLPGRENRAIAGASAEGATAFEVGTNDIDEFGSMGIFSTGLFGGLLMDPKAALYPPFEPQKSLPGLVKKLRTPGTNLKVLYFSVGTLDPRAPYIEKAAQGFAKLGIKPTFKIFEGGHQDKVFRYSLADFVTFLFR